jgi:hypothetical protein
MPAWDRARPEELHAYTAALQEQLLAVRCPGSLLHCRDPQCQDAAHSEERDAVVLDLLLAIVETSYVNLPLTRPGGERAAEGPGYQAWLEC